MIKRSNPTPMLLAAFGAALFTGACERSQEAERVRGAEREAQRANENATREQAQATEADRRAREAALEAERARVAARPPSPLAATMAINEALTEIAGSRCEREMRCGHVGTSRRYESDQACRAVIRNDFAGDLNAAECPSGIDRRELAECMLEVRNEDCASPFDTLGRIAACRTSDMCRTTPTVSAR